MTGYPIGMIILILLSISIYLGFAHRILDRLRLTDRMALVIIGLLIIGSFITIPLTTGPPSITINIGGALIPIGLAIYLLIKAGTRKEWFRALIATAVTIGVIGLSNRFLFSGDPWHTGQDIIDPLYIYPIIAGLTAYIIGRSRRSAFIAATLGVLSLDVFHYLELLRTNVPGTTAIGGAGIFDAIIIAGILAVFLAEIIGEGRERLQGGPESKGRPEELLKNLDSAMPQASLKPISKKQAEEENRDE